MNEGASGGVLAGMQKLRSLASYSHSASTSSEEATTVHSILAGSVKLRILVSLLIRIRAMGDKVVLVSNFTTHLDHIETLAVTEGWRTLRIDGQVASSARQSLIDRFNSKTDATFVFLLSSRAGGVGINLIGANRLIMYSDQDN
jgi:SNF2 family DNA or RNA helicase